MATDTLTRPAPKPAINGADAFRDWQHALRQIEASNPEDSNTELWSKKSAAEDSVEQCHEPCLLSIEQKLWMALQYRVDLAGDHEAVVRANLPPLLAQRDNLDWDVRLVLSAIVTLRAMQETGK